MNLVENYKILYILTVTGYSSWSFFRIRNYNDVHPLSLKTLFLQEVLARGIYTLGTHNLSYLHPDKDIERLLTCYDKVFPILFRALNEDNSFMFLKSEFLKPLFKVR